MVISTLNRVVVTAFAFFLALMVSSCAKEKDFGMFGSIYVRSDSPVRNFSSLEKFSAEKESYTVFLGEYAGEPKPYIVKNGMLYVLYAYGDEHANLRFFYPDEKVLLSIKKTGAPGLLLSDACLGIKWLKSNAPMQTSKNLDHGIYFLEGEYRKNVIKTVGKFCDQ